MAYESMLVYVSAPIPRKADANRLAAELISRGHYVCSTWHEESTATGYDQSPEVLHDHCMRDLTELSQSNVLVHLGWDGSSGGIAGELAVALFCDLPVEALGEKRSVWSHCNTIRWHQDEASLLCEFGDISMVEMVDDPPIRLPQFPSPE